MKQQPQFINLPAEYFWVGVHDIQRLFEAAILNKADYFTVQGRHIIPVFMQNCNRRGEKLISNATQGLKQYILTMGLTTIKHFHGLCSSCV